MNIIFQVNGGIGKCVMATAVCEAIHKKYPNDNLIVISGYPEVFLNNLNIFRSYNFNGLNYFYNDYVKNKDFLVFAHDPYLATTYLKQNESLIKTWCDMFEIPYNNENPKIYLTARELKFFENKFKLDKPILLIQPNGGIQTEQKYSWARDIPSNIIVDVINKFKTDYSIVHIKREDQFSYDNTIPINDTFRALCVLISISEKRLFMDSFAQHVAAAINMRSTVCWIVNTSEVFGYKIHHNIKANSFTKNPELIKSYLQEFNITGDLLEFPYNNENEIFNIDKIIESIKN